jgi:hypothetical protein
MPRASKLVSAIYVGRGPYRDSTLERLLDLFASRDCKESKVPSMAKKEFWIMLKNKKSPLKKIQCNLCDQVSVPQNVLRVLADVECSYNDVGKTVSYTSKLMKRMIIPWPQGLWAVGALALRTTENAHGNYHFFKLKSGLLLTRTYVTKLPMPDEVIDRVHALVRRQRAQLLLEGVPLSDEDEGQTSRSMAAKQQHLSICS